MADDRLGFEAFRPIIESQMAFIHGALKFNVAMMQAWLGSADPRPERDQEEDHPSEACKNPEYMSPQD